jgi:site-specific recombinase XerD
MAAVCLLYIDRYRRHAIAAQLVQRGARFKEIADLLRHRSIDTTTIYAKVDFPALARVALPWPWEADVNARKSMASWVEAYLTRRRHAGFALRIEGQQLARFARFVDQQRYRGPLTVKLAMKWAVASRRPKLLTAARRIEVLQSFCRYCQQLDPATENPPRGLFGPAHRRLTPHIYTDAEISALLNVTVGWPRFHGRS